MNGFILALTLFSALQGKRIAFSYVIYIYNLDIPDTVYILYTVPK